MMPKTEHIALSCSVVQKEQWRAQARRIGVTMPEYIRLVLDAEQMTLEFGREQRLLTEKSKKEAEYRVRAAWKRARGIL